MSGASLIAKRLFDILVSSVALVATLPITIPVALLIFLGDRHSPFYVSARAGRFGRDFPLVKFRSMVVDADQSGVDSTSAGDSRITRTGAFIRRFKLDELPQFWNVLRGHMSVVGPRPNVGREVRLYTDVEKRLLGLRPGITDLSSIVFSDEGEILEGSSDPDLLYNQIIRPWKSRLGLIYVEHCSLRLDVELIFLTAISIMNHQKGLDGVVSLLTKLGSDPELIAVARRRHDLKPYPPPGAERVVESRR